MSRTIRWLGKAGSFIGSVVFYGRRSLPRHYRDVFDNPAGKIVLADLHRKAGVMMAHEGHTDSEQQYATGRRDMVLYIDAMLRARPQDIQQIAEMRSVDDK